MKTNYFNMEIKSVDIQRTEEKEVLYISGYASTPDLDSYLDIVRPEAFSLTMKQYMQEPLILLQHNIEKVIGKATDYEIQEKGLFIKAEIYNNTDGVFENIKNGTIRHFSIGYRVKSFNILNAEEEQYIREIKELELVENSLVVKPANKNAIFTLDRSIKSFFDELEIKSIGNYEIKDDEVLEIKSEEIKEEKEEIKEEEAPQEETKPENIEIVGENPTADIDGVENDKVRDLETENLSLKQEINELRESLSSKEEELKEILEQKSKLDEEVKSYLGTGIFEKKEEQVKQIYIYKYF